VPALLYFLCVFIYINLTAQKMSIRASMETVNGKQLLMDAPVFFLPLGVLVFLLVKGFTLPYVGFWSILTVVALGIISGALRKEVRLDLRQTIRRIVESVRSASETAMICGLLGVVVSAVVSSGLGVKLPLAIEDLSHGILLIALFITMISSILLGIGVPTPAAYMLVAVGAVPALLNMGVPLLQAHLYCFVFAMCSHFTPPIAIGALVASQIAGANYWGTAWESVKAAFAKYLLPFFFIYAPVTILRPDSGFAASLAQIVAILAVIISLQIGISNYCFTKLSLNERSGFIMASALCLVSIFSKNYLFFVAGLLVLMVALAWQFKK
jgi:TRAP-type uncharacterized transport system fused permease subunit